MAAEPCGAKTRNGGKCGNPGSGRGGRCRLHGGKSLAGPAHPNFKHGRASTVVRSLPDRLRRAFDASYEDGDILSMRTEIALSDARLAELVEKIDTRETGEAWASAQEGLRDLRYLLAQRPDVDWDAVDQRMKHLRGIMSGALEDEKNWSALRRQVEHRRKLTDTERKLVEAKQAYVEADHLDMIVARLLHSINTNVKDLPGGKEAITQIVLDVRALIGSRDRPVAEELSA